MAYFLPKMEIVLDELGKKFTNEWIFRKLNIHFGEGVHAVTGPNGSGKSTFLLLLSGLQPATEGKIIYKENHKIIPPDKIYKYLAIAAPYLELIEELTLAELFNFQVKFKKFHPALSLAEFVDKVQLPKSKNKSISFFSSGMKQRVKLGLSMYSSCPFLLLDEPTSNLDKEGCNWYKNEIIKNISQKLVLIASNIPAEYDFLTQNIIKIK